MMSVFWSSTLMMEFFTARKEKMKQLFKLESLKNVKTLKMSTTVGAMKTRRTGAETPVTSTTYRQWMGTVGET